MTEIKFRAWEKQLKEIIPVYNIDFQSKIINRGSAWRFFHEIELMPSTGLRDKNGVEIYEGHITKDSTGIVTYIKSDGFEWFEVIIKDPTNRINKSEIPFTRNSSYTLEIVGNIYENKELLEEK